MTRWQLTCSGFALLLAACGDDDDDAFGGKGGSAGARAGSGGQSSGGRSVGGSAGALRGGAAGAAKGGTSGASSGGASGALKGGSSGMAQGGSSGTPQGGSSGTLQGGSVGVPEGGAGGEPEGGADQGGEGGGSEAGAGGGGSPKSSFSCSDLAPLPSDATARSCQDFAQAGSGSAWTSDGGTWTISGGAYVATGPASEVACTTGGSLMTASTLSGLSATNVRVRARLTSIDRADKVIVLRARDPRNRIEVNFRTTYTDGPNTLGGDVYVQELVDCTQVGHGFATVAHELGQAIDVVIELRGQAVSIDVDGANVLSRTFATLSTAPGSVGFGVILGGTAEFDNFVVEVLD